MNSKRTIKIWTIVLAKACAGKTKAEQKAAILRLAEILESKKKGYLLAKIIERTLVGMSKQKKLEITIAHAQTDETIEKLKKNIAKRLDGWEEVETKINPGIIGGFIARTEQCLLDASVKNQLEQLRKRYES